MKLRLLYLFACLVLVSCSKDEQEDITPEEEPESFCYPQGYTELTYLVTGEVHNWEHKFEYNALNQLVGKKYFSDDELIMEDNFEYDQSGMLVRENWYSADRMLYAYYQQEFSATGQLLNYTYSTVDLRTQKSSLRGKNVFTYNDKGELITLRHYKAVDGTLVFDSYTDHFYTSGLMTETRSYDSNQQLTKVVKLTYDDKKTYLYALPRIRGQYTSEGFPHVHNELSRTATSPDGKLIAAESYTREITYNAQDYVERMVTKYADGKVRERRFTYDCPKP